jgi:hypothetical protein
MAGELVIRSDPSERAKSLHVGIGPLWVEESDQGHGGLLRPRRSGHAPAARVRWRSSAARSLSRRRRNCRALGVDLNVPIRFN